MAALLILATLNFEMVHCVLLHCNVLMQEGTRVACDIDASFFLLLLMHNVVKYFLKEYELFQFLCTLKNYICVEKV